MESLSNDAIILIALELGLDALYKLCLTNKKFNKIVCMNELFWMKRVERDYGNFGHNPKVINRYGLSWKEYYKVLHSLNGKYIWHIFRTPRDPDVVKVLLNDNRIDPAMNDNSPIKYAAEYGNIDTVKVLLSDPRVDPTAENNYAIRWAAIKNRIPMVKVLLSDSRIRSSSTGKEIEWALDNGVLSTIKHMM